jgi:hypothetical protein
MSENKKPIASSPIRRRSARVVDRDPIIAPGFGTRKDLAKLSQSLGLPVDVVHQVMRTRGAGTGTDHAAAAAAASSSSAWADFMADSGVVAASATAAPSGSQDEMGRSRSKKRDSSAMDSKTSATTTSATTATPRDYVLPLTPDDGPRRGGLLVQAGTLDSTIVGRRGEEMAASSGASYHCATPTILSALMTPSVRLAQVASHCSAAHSLAVDTEGKLWGWGRNEAYVFS